MRESPGLRPQQVCVLAHPRCLADGIPGCPRPPTCAGARPLPLQGTAPSPSSPPSGWRWPRRRQRTAATVGLQGGSHPGCPVGQDREVVPGDRHRVVAGRGEPAQRVGEVVEPRTAMQELPAIMPRSSPCHTMFQGPTSPWHHTGLGRPRLHVRRTEVGVAGGSQPTDVSWIVRAAGPPSGAQPRSAGAPSRHHQSRLR